MKCTICGRDAPPGTTVCADCAAALKRAYDTVSPVEPPARGTTATDRPGVAVPTPAGKTAPETALPIGAMNPLATGLPRQRTAVAAVIAILTVVVFAYYEFRGPPVDRSNGHPAAVAAPAAIPMPPASSPADTAEKAPASAPLEEGAGASSEPSSSTSKPGVDTLKPLPARPRKQAPSTAAPAPSAIEPAPASVIAEPSGAPIQAAPAPPAPDRWQQMREAIAQCAPENLLARIVCEQRARLRYCDGYWGQAPQCPAGVNNDHGQ